METKNENLENGRRDYPLFTDRLPGSEGKQCKNTDNPDIFVERYLQSRSMSFMETTFNDYFDKGPEAPIDSSVWSKIS